MTSSLLSRTSALLLYAAALALLFGADDLLPHFVPGLPPGGAWVGQLLGAAWLGVAQYTWMQRSAVLGGIYGRPIVLANLAVHGTSAFVVLDAARRPQAPAALWALLVPFALCAVAFGALMVRGPLARDLAALQGRPPR